MSYQIVVGKYGEPTKIVSHHRTLKAAFRRLGSHIAGKRKEPCVDRAYVYSPDHGLLTYVDIRNILQEGSL
jgi:hypothetical protein